MGRILQGLLLTLAFACSAIPAAAQADWLQDGLNLTNGLGDLIVERAVTDGHGGCIVAMLIWGQAGVDVRAQHVDAAGTRLWGTAGTLVSAGTANSYWIAWLHVVPDGADGAIVVWAGGDQQSALIAQRLNATGERLWATEGVPLCALAARPGNSSAAASDGLGGAIVVWEDGRDPAGSDIYAQRISNSGQCLWDQDGVAVCLAAGDQVNPHAVPDGTGGGIFAWEDQRSDYSGTWTDIYARRVNAAGQALWATDGTAVSTAAGEQHDVAMAIDGAGGAYVSWDGPYQDSHGIAAQRLNSDGMAQWSAGGVLIGYRGGQYVLTPDVAGGLSVVFKYDPTSGPPFYIMMQHFDGTGTSTWDGPMSVCRSTESIYSIRAVAGANGDVIVSWTSGERLRAQLVSERGEQLWAAAGVPVCNLPNVVEPQLVPGADGSTIFVWLDWRSQQFEIYAQIIDSRGVWGAPSPIIGWLRDVAADEGGWLDLRVMSPTHDREGVTDDPIIGYNVWRRLPAAPGGGNASLDSDKTGMEIFSAIEAPLNTDCVHLTVEQATTAGFPPGEWASVGFHAAVQAEEYRFVVPTRQDAIGDMTPWEMFAVSAHTARPGIYFISGQDSAFSIDNLEPATPDGIAGFVREDANGLDLSWSAARESDFAQYVVSRGANPEFTPGPDSWLAYPTQSHYFDAEWTPDNRYYYKVVAVDRHGNQSAPALLAPDDARGEDVPSALFLAQNAPNPFNPRTRMAFGLVNSGAVSLRIYDVAGRLVKTLVEGMFLPGSYSREWDGRGDHGEAIASAVYVVRLVTEQGIRTSKLTLAR